MSKKRLVIKGQKPKDIFINRTHAVFIGRTGWDHAQATGVMQNVQDKLNEVLDILEANGLDRDSFYFSVALKEQ
jgi:hypothetical protein